MSFTKEGANCMHVSVVSLAINWVAGAIAVGEQTGGVVTDEGEQQHHGGTCDPPELSDRPR